MDNSKICAWLGLPTGVWPPDHYTLLGLTPGETDVTRIEQHVHERLAKLRCYQLSHPDQATEAMNRLAQAFMCLTDTAAKKMNGAPVAGTGSVGAETAVAPAGVAMDDTAVQRRTQVDWQSAPPPVRLSQPGLPAAAVDALGETPATATVVGEAAPEAPPPVAEPADQVYEAAFTSAEARRGIGTMSALVERIDHTRRLLWAWEQAGRYLNRPKRKLSRQIEQNDLSRRLEQIAELMEDFPHILGQPGQPGYRVTAIARLEMTATMFCMLDPYQRDALAQDWLAGRIVLLAYRRFLHRQFQKVRKSSLVHRGVRALRAAVNDHPLRVLAGLAATALCLGLFYLMI